MSSWGAGNNSGCKERFSFGFGAGGDREERRPRERLSDTHGGLQFLCWSICEQWENTPYLNWYFLWIHGKDVHCSFMSMRI